MRRTIAAATIGIIVGALSAPIILASNAEARNVIVVDGTGRDGAVLLAPEIRPGDTVTNIVYPGTVLWPSYNRSVDAGKQALREALAEAPEDTLVVGYSQGSRIVGDVLTEEQKPGVAGILYSDPRQAGAGIETQLPFNLPGALMSGEREGFSVPVESHCIESDGVCDWSNADPVGSIVGYLKVHTRYFG
ncbi:PE-PPE domain-containing protein [Rhodococcus erythropolis]|uniref:PE-PPE domain-containing protein n=1 Tax=Rhodococcus erythropolis TaxID=1833 RepID=UPI001BE7BEC2|nr:PE-PPE domain-containing protein [Rhodococcus erythropolis]MBT2266428.1 PE-PPE domain-containing protein [Rhodococcus erythropolis]